MSSSSLPPLSLLSLYTAHSHSHISLFPSLPPTSLPSLCPEYRRTLDLLQAILQMPALHPRASDFGGAAAVFVIAEIEQCFAALGLALPPLARDPPVLPSLPPGDADAPGTPGSGRAPRAEVVGGLRGVEGGFQIVPYPHTSCAASS